MMVDLPEPEGPDQRGDRAGFRDKGNAVQHLLAGLVREMHIVEFHAAFDALEGHAAPRILIFLRFVQDFAGAFEAGDGFGDLRADGHDLENRGDQKDQKRRVGNQLASGHRARQDVARANVHDQRADQAHERRTR